MVFPSELLDEINLKILDILSRDASRPYVDVAKELEISDATVHIRVRRLVWQQASFVNSQLQQTTSS